MVLLIGNCLMFTYISDSLSDVIALTRSVNFVSAMTLTLRVVFVGE